MAIALLPGGELAALLALASAFPFTLLILLCYSIIKGLQTEKPSLPGSGVSIVSGFPVSEPDKCRLMARFVVLGEQCEPLKPLGPRRLILLVAHRLQPQLELPVH